MRQPIANGGESAGRKMNAVALGETLVVRNPGLKWSEAYRRFCHRDSSFLTSTMNALSILIPEGERFFIESVRHYLDEIRDPELHAQVVAFIGQEGAHAREHQRYNELVEAHGYPVRKIAEGLRRHLKQRSASMPPKARLAMTCALEHFTTIVGAAYLRIPTGSESVAEDHARLWFWHGVEELEHKSVAFDVYRAVGGSYWERIREMILATCGFWTAWLAITLTCMSHDRRLWSVREWWTALVWWFVRPAFLLRLLPRYLAYYRRDFHPSQYDGQDEELIHYWRAQLGLSPAHAG